MMGGRSSGLNETLITGRRFSFTVLVIAFALGSITILQLLPTMDEIEYSQEGYFNISKSDRARSIWNEEPVIFNQGRPELIESGPLYNVTSRELMAWFDIIVDYSEYLSERGVQWSFLFEPRDGVIKVGICDLTEEKAQLFVDIMKHYVPMGVISLQNATIIRLRAGTLPGYLTLDWEVDRYNLSSHVFVGKVTMKESKRIGENNSGGIFTYITVQVERYDKGWGENEVIVRHIGGTVGNITSSHIYAYNSPIFSVTVGQKYLFFNNKIEGEENLYTVKYIKMNMKP